MEVKITPFFFAYDLGRNLLRKAGMNVIMDDKNQLAVEASEPVPQEVMEKYDQEMDKKTRDNMERFAEFMARMIEKYGRKVLAGIEDDEAPNDTQSGEKANAE